MSTLQTLVFKAPVVPTREYWGDNARTVKPNNKTRTDLENKVVENTPVMKEWRHGLEGEEYKAKMDLSGTTVGLEEE